MEENIANASKEGDLSLRHIEGLRSGLKKGQNTLPPQVKTRHSKKKGAHRQTFFQEYKTSQISKGL